MKIYTYTDFTFQIGHLSFEEAERIYDKIINSANQNDPEFQQIWKDFIFACIKYTEARGKWLLVSREEQMEFDSYRTHIHDDVIFNLKLIKAIALENGKNADWYYDFNDDRKRIGDFANYIVYCYAINAR